MMRFEVVESFEGIDLDMRDLLEIKGCRGIQKALVLGRLMISILILLQ
jgi:hypothetical protein